MSCHQLRMVCTAKAAVSLPIPTFTQPVGGKIMNSMGHGAAEFVDQEVARMNLFRVAFGRHSRSAFLTSPASSFYFVSTEISSLAKAPTASLMKRN